MVSTHHTPQVQQSEYLRSVNCLPQDWKETLVACLRNHNLVRIANRIETKGVLEEDRRYVALDWLRQRTRIGAKLFKHAAQSDGINLDNWPDHRLFMDLICLINEISLSKKDIKEVLRERTMQDALTRPIFEDVVTPLIKEARQCLKTEQIYGKVRSRTSAILEEITLQYSGVKKIINDWDIDVRQFNTLEEKLVDADIDKVNDPYIMKLLVYFDIHTVEQILWQMWKMQWVEKATRLAIDTLESEFKTLYLRNVA